MRKLFLMIAICAFFSDNVSSQIMNCSQFCVLNMTIDTVNDELDVTIYNGDTNQVNYPTVYVVDMIGDTVGNAGGSFFLFAHGAGDTITHVIPTTLDSLPASFSGTIHFRDQIWDTSCAFTYPMLCNPASIYEKFIPDAFTAYPNPSAADISIRFNRLGVKSITLFDHSGKVILRNSTSEEYMILKKGDLSNGLYFLEAIIDGKRYTEKVIFQ